MKLKTYMLFNAKRIEIVWRDEAFLFYNKIEVGHIEKVKWNKETGEVEIIFRINEENKQKIKDLLK
ncbi:MAG: hypothetical protein ACTSWG_13310 [Candidatus Helarchaeota archaeon]